MPQFQHKKARPDRERDENIELQTRIHQVVHIQRSDDEFESTMDEGVLERQEGESRDSRSSKRNHQRKDSRKGSRRHRPPSSCPMWCQSLERPVSGQLRRHR